MVKLVLSQGLYDSRKIKGVFLSSHLRESSWDMAFSESTVDSHVYKHLPMKSEL